MATYVRYCCMEERGNIMLKTKKYGAIALVCLACLTSGCGKPQSVADEVNRLENGSTEEEIDTKTDTSDESAAIFNKGKLSDSLGIQDGKWETTFAVNAEDIKKVKIHVDVELPDTDHMSVEELKLHLNAPDAIKDIADKLFDNGKVGVLDEEQYPKWKLEMLIPQYEKRVAEWNERPIEAEDEESKKMLEENKKEDEERLNKYKKQLSQASDDMVMSDDYGENDYWGEIDGKTWELVKYEAGNDEYYGIDARLGNSREGLVTEVDAKKAYIYTSLVQEDVENVSSISKEDAIRQAENFLSEIGYGEYEVKEAASIKWEIESYDSKQSEEFVEGYQVNFGRAVDGIQVSTGNYSLSPIEENTIETYMDEEAWVTVTDVGVIRFGVQCPRTLRVDSEEETALLSFDKIQRRVEEVIEEKAIQKSPDIFPQSGNTLELYYMDLVYLVLTGDEYIVIPVWRIYDMRDNVINSCIVLNAIDGSEINLASMYCDTLSDAEWEEKFGSDE